MLERTYVRESFDTAAEKIEGFFCEVRAKPESLGKGTNLCQAHPYLTFKINPDFPSLRRILVPFVRAKGTKKRGNTYDLHL